MTRWLLESSGEDELVFRPDGYPLPLARGRVSLELAPDGSFEAREPGPDDRPVPTDSLRGWVVASVNSDRLVLRRG